jgi:hypothetical protein
MDTAPGMRDQVIVITHWRAQVYGRPLPLSALLRAGLDAAAIHMLKQQHLAAFMGRFQSELCSWLGAVLDERRTHILIRRFALDGQAKTLLANLGADEGVSRERIRQIEQGAGRSSPRSYWEPPRSRWGCPSPLTLRRSRRWRTRRRISDLVAALQKAGAVWPGQVRLRDGEMILTQTDVGAR